MEGSHVLVVIWPPCDGFIRNALRGMSYDYCSRIHSYWDRTGPAVGPVKDRTRAYSGPGRLKDRPCNRTAINRLNRPVFCRTGEPDDFMRTGGFFSFSEITPL
jgi:hypothetical protein